MKTFTNCAEQKAKQFLNLLQGYTKGIRFTAILILLLMGVSNAWAAYNQTNTDLYFDNSESKWEACYVYVGKGDYTSCYVMTRVLGTQYLWRLEKGQWNWGNSWNGATGWVVCYEKWWDDKSESIDKYTWHGAKNVTKKSTSAWVNTKIYKTNGTTSVTSDGNTINAYAVTSYTKSNYTVTINTTTGGTLTVKDYDNNEVASGASKIHLTVLKFNATASTGYTFGGVQINNGSTTTTIAAADITSKTYTLTSNVTITPIWTAVAETKYDVTISANANGSVNPSGTLRVGATAIDVTATADPGYQFKQWSNTGGAKAVPSNSATTQVTATANGSITASFEEILYDITITSNNAAYGDVNPKSAKAGITTTVDITATPEQGYEFVKWSAPSSITLANANIASTTITKTTAKGTVSATFQEKKHDVIISYKCGNTSIQSDATQEVGEATPTSITAPEHTGYTFTGWTLGTGITNHSANTTTNPISITTNSNGSGYTLTANYEKAKYTLTFGVQGGIGGSVRATVGGNAISSPATFEHGTEITLTATADDKYAFIQWVDGSGASLSTANPYTHTLTATTTIQAVFANTDVLYLKPIGNWKQNNEWYAAYFYKEGTGDNFWVRMKNEDPCGGSVYYKTLIPDGDWTHVIFIRMDGSTTDLKWENKWDQTVDLTIPADGKNCFTNGSKNNDKFTGSWSTHTPTNYDPVVFNVTVPAGTPNCYIIGDWDGWSQFTEMTKVDDTHYTVTMYDVCKNSLHYKYCYGPSWGCQEVKTTANSTQAVDNREYSASDNVVAWVKYCLVGADLGWSWNSSYSFDIAGDMNYVFDKKDYYIKVMSSTGKYYTHNEYNYELHRSHTSVKIPYEGGENNELIFKADMQGNYHFQFDPVSKQLTIEFPEKGYQLKIKMSDEQTVYTSNAVDNAGDIFSFFAPGTTDNTLRGTVELYLNGNKQCTIPAVSFDTSRVYVAKLNSARNGIDNIAPYTGNYYIRTDGANGGWNNYKTNADSKMTYFVPREKEKYSYYWVAALPQADRNESNGVVNVKACVANEYNENLAVMLGGDKFTDGNGNVAIKDPSEQKREKINVRFGYNPKTNHFERAMLTGSGNMPNFLNITDPDGCVFKDKNLTTALTEANSDSKFTDVSNWVYETNVWVQPDMTNGATVRLTATAYNDSINSLLGFEADGVTPKQDTIIGKSSGEKREMRIVYDFKTNRMIMAWIPGDITISDQEALHADVLFIRHENDDVPQLKITSNGKIKDIQSQFFALELENDANNGGNQEHHYWISLPFDCVVGSISGVPGYMEIWGIQRYNGKKRAEKGWFKEDYTFWEWLTPNDILKAGEGYVLSFDKKAATWNTYDVHEKDENGNTISTTQKSLLRLYFPSTKTGYLFQENTQLRTDYPNQPCNIERENRKQQDSNWKIIATTSYYNAQVASGEDYSNDSEHYLSEFPNFRYTYTYDNSNMNNRTWSYTPEHGGQGAEYKSFHSYMVQYAGTITWKALNESVMPVGLAARRNSNAKATNITTRLELANAEGIKQDQTFVALDEKGTTTFDQNLDLNKVFNSGKANVYTLSEGIPFAGNTLPMEEVVVPVGVKVDAEGEYTFRMPDGTEGMVVEFIDYELETTTNLLLFDYTVTLPKGTSEGRFALHIQPSKSGVTTGVGNVGDEAKGIEKYLIDGKLIIRTAEGVFDARGHRL